MELEPDTQVCPMCGAPNGCAMASGEPDGESTCWCRAYKLTSETRTLAAASAPAAAACLCEACLRKLQ
jgi:hypothetical protein